MLSDMMENQATVTNNPNFLAAPQVRGSLGESLQIETRDYRQPYADLFAGTSFNSPGRGHQSDPASGVQQLDITFDVCTLRDGLVPRSKGHYYILLGIFDEFGSVTFLHDIRHFSLI